MPRYHYAQAALILAIIGVLAAVLIATEYHVDPHLLDRLTTALR